MTTKHFYRFSYFTAEKKDRELLLHQLRDGDAALELSEPLFKSGYRYGGLLLNYPHKERANRREVDEGFLHRGDLLLLTTRPPLDDEIDQPRKPLVKSNTTLEEKVFRALRLFFQHCSRSQVILSEVVSRQLPPGFNKRNVQFKQYGGSVYDSCDRQKHVGAASLTAAYLASMPEAWPGGPGLLCAFGMGGQETLSWAHLLRTRHRPLLRRALLSGGFIMAEIELEEVRPPQDDLTFYENWQVEILADIQLDRFSTPSFRHANI